MSFSEPCCRCSFGESLTLLHCERAPSLALES
ncbi:hypothetical protein VDBG_08878 [Verticillium alfalfae VaMs.102]|uniref:Uncharacterized protein n=1 Tax=Verticillium alfalfae (strain VaMs.102 / ATCC MYA-4576 / FGSC 10136) TaxID=526221 RepID=C9SVF3_VERA1|nr:hypothetical protein VDBG_08878 [Verticillium alfalfae VaMs.102]EEY22768.1 hypothetical protein VDBG_08878 [Verticillium alfalfae VaMs.102]